MKDFSKATPRPWTLTHNSWETTSLYGADGDSLGHIRINSDVTEDTQDRWETEKEANAELIVTAVNNFNKMKEACEALEGLRDFIANHHGDDSDETPLLDRALEAIQNLPNPP